MKIIHLLLFSLFLSASVNAQSCLPEGITFNTQAQIDSFPINYPNCTEIEGDAIIQGDDITNLNGFSMITQFSGSLKIGMGALVIGNPLLKNLSGLDNLTLIGGDLEIYYNDSLNSIIALESLEFIGGNLGIGRSPELNSLAGLSLIDTVGGLGLEWLWSLENLVGLENLKHVDGHLSITMCNQLVNLSELNNLNSINGNLRITSNWLLNSLSGLDNIIESSIIDLSIYHNDSLSTCEINSICEYLASPNGDIWISENNIGCNNQQEIEDACESFSIDENDNQNSVTIYPNPTHSTITIELPNQPSKNISLTISNTNGQQFITQPITEPQTEIDISHLSAGIYIVKVWNDKDVVVRKVIKQ